jgi:hypothetical protein
MRSPRTSIVSPSTMIARPLMVDAGRSSGHQNAKAIPPKMMSGGNARLAQDRRRCSHGLRPKASRLPHVINANLSMPAHSFAVRYQAPEIAAANGHILLLELPVNIGFLCKIDAERESRCQVLSDCGVKVDASPDKELSAPQPEFSDLVVAETGVAVCVARWTRALGPMK